MTLGPVHLSWQNLDEDGHGRLRSRWRHGRAWLRIGGWNALRWEWSFAGMARLCHLGTQFLSDEILISFHASLPRFASLYLTIPRPFSRKRWLPASDHGWEVEASIHDSALWLDFFSQPWAPISFGDPWWKRRKITIRPASILFGAHVHRKEEIGFVTGVLIPMPEGSYRGTAKRERATWTRPRFPWWPLTIVREYWWIEVEGGVPHPGKGESAWDCGEDATMAAGKECEQLEGAIASFVETVLRSRRRYGGGLNWLPKGATVALAAGRKAGR